MTSKITKDQMLKEISDELIIYLKKGQLNIDSYIEKLDLDIENLINLLEIHFILQKKVIEFIQELPRSIRNIRTSVTKEENLRNEVNGRINWQNTINHRLKENYLDKTSFVCVENNKNYNIPENLVLKELLNKIDYVINNNEKILSKNNIWNKKWITENKLIKTFNRIYKRNVYINRINTEGIKITNRMIKSAKKSRNEIYREAATLLELYNKIFDFDNWDKEIQKLIKDILTDTFITPDDINVLFEIYWTIKLIRLKSEEPTFNLIDGNTNIVASWQDSSHHYSIYHDSTGPKELKWSIDLDEISDSNNKYLKRVHNSKTKFNEIVKKHFIKETNNSIWQGRPDIILVKHNSNKEIVKVHIGEIKYTNDKNYALEGLKELIDYIHLLKNDNEFIDKTSINIEGNLFVDKVDIPKVLDDNIITFNNIKRI